MKIILLFVLILSADSVFAQSLQDKKDGLITGSVVDFVTKQPLIGANIIIPGTSTGTATDLNGNFKIENLEPGTYQLRASVIGYESQTKTDIVVSPGRLTTVSFQLNPSAIELEGVVVKSDFFGNNPLETSSIGILPSIGISAEF